MTPSHSGRPQIFTQANVISLSFLTHAVKSFACGLLQALGKSFAGLLGGLGMVRFPTSMLSILSNDILGVAVRGG